MLAKQLISDKIPPLKTSDTGAKALQWMEEFKLSELPIVNNQAFLGLVSEDDILAMDHPEEALGNHSLSLEKPYVHGNDHIYDIISKISDMNLSILPVLDENDHYIGVVCGSEILKRVSKAAAFTEPGGILQLEMDVNDYSLSEIANIVESNGAKILSSYLTTHPDSIKMDVTIKINRSDLSRIIQTFERYNYTIVASFHKSEVEEDLNKRFDSFLHYLNM